MKNILLFSGSLLCSTTRVIVMSSFCFFSCPAVTLFGRSIHPVIGSRLETKMKLVNVRELDLLIILSRGEWNQFFRLIRYYCNRFIQILTQILYYFDSVARLIFLYVKYKTRPKKEFHTDAHSLSIFRTSSEVVVVIKLIRHLRDCVFRYK